MQTIILAAAFNLVCSGVVTSDSQYARHKVEAYSKVYRLNLDAGKWCEGECKYLFDFVSVDQTRITFVDKPAPIGFGSELQIVNRETGEHRGIYTARSSFGPEGTDWKGQCQKSPFTGFPAFPTKF